MIADSTCPDSCLHVVQRYQHLFDANSKHSFYLQSKVHRARERIELDMKEAAAKGEL